VMRACRIPRAYPEALLDGMEQDARGARPVHVFDLLQYAYRVASSVGLMMCHVMGIGGWDARRQAAHLGIAMQLTNVCRDVVEDWELGRRYVPDELLARHGGAWITGRAPGAAPLPALARVPLADCARDLLELADRFYRSADLGMGALPWRAALGVRTARHVYARIGDVIAARDHDVLAGRAVVSRAGKAAAVARSLGAALVDLPRRLVRPFRAVPLVGVTRFPDDVLPL
jgi:phytoene synthase